MVNGTNLVMSCDNVNTVFYKHTFVLIVVEICRLTADLNTCGLGTEVGFF